MDPDLSTKLVRQCSNKLAATYLRALKVAPAKSLCGCSGMLLLAKLDWGRVGDIMVVTLLEVFSEESEPPVDGGLESQRCPRSWV